MSITLKASWNSDAPGFVPPEEVLANYHEFETLEDAHDAWDATAAEIRNKLVADGWTNRRLGGWCWGALYFVKSDGERQYSCSFIPNFHYN